MKKMKRWLSVWMAVMIFFLSVPTVPTADAAESGTLQWYANASGDIGQGRYVDGWGLTLYGTEHALYMGINGRQVYCLDPGQASVDGDGMLGDTAPVKVRGTEWGERKQKLFSYAFHYGMVKTGSLSSYASNPDVLYKTYATQILVWNIAKGLFRPGSGADDRNGDKIDDESLKNGNAIAKMFLKDSLTVGGNYGDEAYAYYETVRDKVIKAINTDIPSFTYEKKEDAEKDQNMLPLTYNPSTGRYETTLTDADGHLSDFKVATLPTNVNCEKSGNKLTIYATKNLKNTKTLKLEGTGAYALNGLTKGATYYWKHYNKDDNQYQEYGEQRAKLEPLYGYVTVYTEEEQPGYLQIKKTDENGNAMTSTCVFTVYSNARCTKEVTYNGNTVKLTVSGGSKKSNVAKVPAAGVTYYLRETTCPSGYEAVSGYPVESYDTQTIDPDSLPEIVNWLGSGKLVVYKTGEVLDDFNGSSFVYKNQPIPGCSFELYANATIKDTEGNIIYERDDYVDSATSDDYGEAEFYLDYSGSYYVVETGTDEMHTINTSFSESTHYSVSFTSGKSKTVNCVNGRKKINIRAHKADVDTWYGVSGAVFALYAAEDIRNAYDDVIAGEGTQLMTATSTYSGDVTFSDVPGGYSYYIKEIKAPVKYVRNQETEIYVSGSDVAYYQCGDNSSYTYDTEEGRIYNTPVKGEISFRKTDSETGVTPQGDAKFYHALYGLYARNTITHPDGHTGTLYTAGQLVDTCYTDSKGFGCFTDLWLGDYYIKEIQPSEGYLLDSTQYNVSLVYQGDLVEIVYADLTVKEVVMKQGFQIIKVKSNENETEEPVLESAGFQCYLTSALKHKADGTVDYENSTPVVIGPNGETELFTDSLGYMKTIPIPYGTYTVIESVTPHNMTTIKPFTVVVDHDDRVNLQPWRIFDDREFMAKLRIIKMDADTNRSVLMADTEFKIWDVTNAKYVVQYTTYPTTVSHASFFTNGDGELTLPQKLPLGEYIVEEVHAPTGYAINVDGVHVLVDTDTAYQINPDTNDAIITVRFKDVPVHGEVEITKTGDFLVSYGGIEGNFIYESRPLSGAAFSIYAGEDILSSDMHVDENGERIRLYYEGDLVQTATTGALGTVKFTDLPCGRYQIKETNAPEGYVRSVLVSEAAFAYIDENTPVITGEAVCHNEHQKVAIRVYKQDEKNHRPLSGAKFALYAKDDIYNADGELLVTGGSLVEMATSDRGGVVTFSKDLPLGEYYAREIFAPAGYECDTQRMITMSALYVGQNHPFATAAAIVTNASIWTPPGDTPPGDTPDEVEVSKVDVTTGKELPGAKLTVLDESGRVMDEWISTDTPHTVTNLEKGHTYILREELAPEGYLKANDITFTAGSTRKVVMRDEVPYGRICLAKTGDVVRGVVPVKDDWLKHFFRYRAGQLSGATFELYAKEDIVSGTAVVKAGTLVRTVTTGENGFVMIDHLPLGVYELKETRAPLGYQLDATPRTIELRYADQYTGMVQAGVEAENERMKFKIKVIKTADDTQLPLEGAVFGLYSEQPVKDAMGHELISAGALIESVKTDAEGKARFYSNLPVGDYYIKELSAPAGYAVSHKKYAVPLVGENSEGETVVHQKVTMRIEDKPVTVEISKTDITGEQELRGAVLAVYDENGILVEKWKTNGAVKKIQRLKPGRYTLREEYAPWGYTIANEVEFVVDDKQQIRKVTMKDELMKGRIVIEKTDADNGKPLAGTEFEIRDKDGNVIETLVTDEEGKAVSSKLDIGIFKDGECTEKITYYVVETKAARGYVLDDTPHEVSFSYDAGKEPPEVIRYHLSVKNKKHPQTGGNYEPLLFTAVGSLLILLGGVLYIFGKKKDKKSKK